VFTPYFAPREPTGLEVGLVPDRCELYRDDPPIVLRITDAGKLFVNADREDWNGLSDLFSEIYRTRSHRTLYLRADDGVPFQAVADAIDIAENTNVTVASEAAGIEMNKLAITVRLVTPRALNARCPEPVLK
jgi:hypothetical protein